MVIWIIIWMGDYMVSYHELYAQKWPIGTPRRNLGHTHNNSRRVETEWTAELWINGILEVCLAFYCDILVLGLLMAVFIHLQVIASCDKFTRTVSCFPREKGGGGDSQSAGVLIENFWKNP